MTSQHDSDARRPLPGERGATDGTTIMDSSTKRTALFTPILTLCLAFPASAYDWKWSVGLHDMVVPEASSQTLGINGGISVSHLSGRGTLFSGSLNLLVDNDKDDLDPDHIPVWWTTELAWQRRVHEISPASKLSWVVDVDARRNTVSSVEFEQKFFPSIVYDYAGGSVDAGLKAGIGYFRLEIDDDVPKARGYARGDFTNETGAGTLAGRLGCGLGSSSHISFRAQTWASGSSWLENEAELLVSHDMTIGGRQGTLVLRGEYSTWNLDEYSPAAAAPGEAYLPILPWNDDLLVRLYFVMPW